MSSSLCQCAKCRRVYLIDNVTQMTICPDCHAHTSQTIIVNRLPVEAI